MKIICVYCGACTGAHADYRSAASEMGTLLAREGITMVFGGGNVGLMGIAADAALAAGGRVIGVITETFVEMDLAHRGLTELRVVRSMHERKLAMVESSDAFIALPGGIGTGEEILEAFTWSQLGIHLKPCGLLNVRGFFDGMISQLQHMVDEQFLSAEQFSQLIVETEAESMLRRLRSTVPRAMKWVDPQKLEA